MRASYRLAVMKVKLYARSFIMLHLMIMFLLGACSRPAEKFAEPKDTLAAVQAAPDSIDIYPIAPDPFGKLSAAQRLRSYEALRSSMEKKKKSFDGSEQDIASAKKYLVNMLTDSILPFWYETPWDFNGTTETPREGSIACGFFVSTTLQHAGFNINRIKCGQQASSVFINALCKPGSVKWISKNDTAKLVKHMLAQPDGLYLIGLDYHTGFLQKKGNDVWMIHSAFWPHKKVVKEKIQTCAHILESQVFVVGNLLGNDELVRKWINGEIVGVE
jgi:hypothetical protein